MAYSSKIDIRLGEVPKTSDGEAFADLVDIYNAIHIVSQYTASLANRANPDKYTPPWQAMGFNNILWFNAAEAIETGNIVYISSQGACLGVTGEIGTVNLIQGTNYVAFNGASVTGPAPVWGMALNDADAGKPVKVGMGMAVINMEGVKFGDKLYGVAANEVRLNKESNSSTLSIPRLRPDGGIYKNVSRSVATPTSAPYYNRWAKIYVQIGYGIDYDAALIYSPENTRLSMTSRDVEWAINQ